MKTQMHQEQYELTPELVAEFGHNLEIVSRDLGDELQALETSVWDTQQDIVDKLPAAIRKTLRTVYGDIRLANEVVELVRSSGFRTPDTDRYYREFITLIAQGLNQIRELYTIDEALTTEKPEEEELANHPTSRSDKKAQKAAKKEAIQAGKLANREAKRLAEQAKLLKKFEQEEQKRGEKAARREVKRARKLAKQEARRVTKQTKLAEKSEKEERKRVEDVTRKGIAQTEKQAREETESFFEQTKQAQKAEREEKKRTEEVVKKESQLAKKQAREEAKKLAEQDKLAKKSEEEEGKRVEDIAGKEAEQARKQVREEESIQATDAVTKNLDEEVVKLSVVPPVVFAQIQVLKEALNQIEDLHITQVSGSAHEGTTIVISVMKPMSLMDVLRQLPYVEQVVKDKGRIHLRLRSE